MSDRLMVPALEPLRFLFLYSAAIIILTRPNHSVHMATRFCVLRNSSAVSSRELRLFPAVEFLLPPCVVFYPRCEPWHRCVCVWVGTYLPTYLPTQRTTHTHTYTIRTWVSGHHHGTDVKGGCVGGNDLVLRSGAEPKRRRLALRRIDPPGDALHPSV